MALAAVLIVGVFLGWARRGAALTVYGDDAIYLTLARSLATGHYRDEFLLGAPPHAQYPPGMPVWLLLVRLVAGDGLDAAMGANLLLVAVTALLLADSVRRCSTPWLGVLAAAIPMFHPALFSLASQLRSEIPFIACCALALWCSLLHSARGSPWYAAAAVLASLAAFLTRSAGIALIPAVVAGLLLRGQWRAFIAGCAGSALVVSAWFGYTRWATQRTVGHSYAEDFSQEMAGPSHFFAGAIERSGGYFAELAATQFNIPDIPNQPIDNAVWGFGLVILIAIGTWNVSKRWPALGIFLLLSAGVLFVFPHQSSRFVTVYVPWLAAMVLIGLSRVATAAGARHGARYAIAGGLLLASLALTGQLRAAVREQQCRASEPFVDRRCYSPEHSSYVDAARFVRDSLEADAVILASKPSIVYVLSGRKTLPLSDQARADIFKVLAPTGRGTAVLLSRLMGEGADVGPQLLARCSSLVLLRNLGAGTLLIGARGADFGTRPNACESLEAYVKETQGREAGQE